MPVDPKLQTILDAAKALGNPPIEQQTPQQIRADRAQMMARFQPMPEYSSVRVEERTIPSPACEILLRIYTPSNAQPNLPIVVFFHGGGWVVCTLDTHDPYCRALSTEAQVIVVSVDYRLAPEHKFPAAVEDSLAATQWVQSHAQELGADPSQVFVGGDSAGGTLATVVALLLRDNNQASKTTLAGQILLYPVIAHYDPPTPSYLENAEGYGLTRKAMIWYWDHYLNNKSEAEDFRAAPIHAKSLANLPRAFVLTAEYDILRDEGQAYAQRMAEAGVPVTHICAAGMNHAFAASANEFPYLPQAKDVLQQVAVWIKSK